MRLAQASFTDRRCQPMVHETFQAYRVSDNGKPDRLGESMCALQPCVDGAATLCLRGERFVILRTDNLTSELTLHFYTVKEKGEAGWDYDSRGRLRAVKRRYAEHLHDLKPAVLLAQQNKVAA